GSGQPIAKRNIDGGEPAEHKINYPGEHRGYQAISAQSSKIRPANVQFGMILAAMQPVPPAINRYSDKNELQSRISIQRRPVEEDNTQNLIGNGRRPVPDILFHQQPDADRAGNEHKKFCRSDLKNFEEMHL